MAKKYSYGINSVIPYNRTTGEYYGIVEVLGSSELSLEIENVNLNGGCNPWPWASEQGLGTGEVSLVLREKPNFLYEIAHGATATANAAEAAGNVGTAVNKLNATVIDAVTGFVSVTASAGNEANIKTGKYLIKAATADTAELYSTAKVDGITYSDADSLLVTTLDISAGNDDQTTLGLLFTAGSGVAMVAGDTAEFEVRGINSGSDVVTVGNTAEIAPEIGLIIYGCKTGSGDLEELDVFRVKFGGLPLNMTENAFSEYTMTGTVLYDSDKNGIYKQRRIEA